MLKWQTGLNIKMIRFLGLAFLSVLALPLAAMADPIKVQPLPDLIDDTTNRDLGDVEDIAEKFELPEIRIEAVKQAALSLGARAGLAFRSEEILKTLNMRSGSMDRIYDFKRLLIPAPSGLLIEPPIITEGVNATLIEDGGQTAAVTDRIFNINRNAQIVSTARHWRAYLERDWGEIQEPPSILYPRTAEERRVWVENITKGWEQGVTQADEVFQADLNRLVSDYTGMIRYRKLLAQGIVSPPYALQINRGITGGGDEMRVGDRAVQITGPSMLKTEGFEWQPVSR